LLEISHFRSKTYKHTHTHTHMPTVMTAAAAAADGYGSGKSGPIRPQLDEEGCFVYEVIHGDGLAVRTQPSVDNAYRTSMSFEKGDLVAVDYIRYDRRRRRQHPPHMNQNHNNDHDQNYDYNTTTINGPFLRLADGSGWLFAQKNGTSMMAQVTVETGLWAFYVDNVPYGQALRRHPCDRNDLRVMMMEMDDHDDNNHNIQEETAVVYQPLQKIYCDRHVRHPVTHVGFYRVQGSSILLTGGTGGGWVFDRRPDEEFGCMLLDENQVQTGQLFAFVASHSISVRREPTVSDSSRTRRTVHEGDVVVGDLVRDHPYHRFHGPFVRLTDGSGWVFQQKQGHVAMEPMDVETGRWSLQVVTRAGVCLLRQPIDRLAMIGGFHEAEDGVALDSYHDDWTTNASYQLGEVVICDRRIVPDEVLMDESVSSFYRVKNTNGWVVDRRGDQILMDVVRDRTTPREGTLSDGWDPYFVRGIATTVEGLEEIDFDPTFCVLSFWSVEDGVTIKVYYATRTVGTSLQGSSSPNKQHKSKVQQFRQNCTPADLMEIFKTPLAYHSLVRNATTTNIINARQSDSRPQPPTTRGATTRRKASSTPQSPTTPKATRKGKESKRQSSSPTRGLRNKNKKEVDTVAVVDTPFGLGIVVEQEEVLRQKLLDCMSDEQRLQRTRQEFLTSIWAFDDNRAKEAAKMQTNIQLRQAEEEEEAASPLEEVDLRMTTTHTTTKRHTNSPSRRNVVFLVDGDPYSDDDLAQVIVEPMMIQQRAIRM
jgi:hypothetical protein